MSIRFHLWLLAIILLTTVSPAEAQQPKRIARIGYLRWLSGTSSTLLAFKEGLRELGWVEGKQIEIEYRYAGDDDKLSEFAAELVRLKVDVIVAAGSNMSTITAKRATTTIPIVMGGVVDPVTNGFVASLARPGAHVTGVTIEVTREQAGKNLELLKEAVPKVSRVALLRNPNLSGNLSDHMAYSKEAERAAKILGVAIQFAAMHAPNDKSLEDALGTVVHERANALLVAPYPFFADRRQPIIDFTARHKLPAIYSSSVFLLMTVVSCRTARAVKICGVVPLHTLIKS